MVQQVEAVYEGGVLKPLEPLRLSEHQRVLVTVTSDVSHMAEAPELSQTVARQRQAMQELDAKLAGIPDESPGDGFSAADHDKILYHRTASASS